MVEHTSAQTATHQQQREQSFNGVQTQHWYPLPHNRHHLQRDSPDVTKNSGSGSGQRFSLFRWFKRRDSTSSADNRRRHLFRRSQRRPSTSSSSSSCSEDTFYSTATVRSFAFHSGVRRRAEDASLTLEHSSNAVGPFAPGAVKLVERRNYREEELPRINAATTFTLPTAFSQRQGIETRYSLLPVNNPFVSYDSIPIVDRLPRAFAEVRRNNTARHVDTLASDSSQSIGPRKVHVKGKRRAPDPPTQRAVSVDAAGEGGASKPTNGGVRRKRRPAPKPPGYNETLSSNQDTLSSGTSTGMDSLVAVKDCQTISNDTLVLRRGVLLSKRDALLLPNRSRVPTTSVSDTEGGKVVSNQAVPNNNSKLGTIMPRPWYKRNVSNEHSNNNCSRDSTTNTRRGGGDILRGLSSPVPPETKDDYLSSASASSTMSSPFPFEGSLSRLGFIKRGDRHHHDDKKKENKRKSGVSILTNISELDKEAAAIVQEEQARNRASMILQAAKMDEEFERRLGVNEDIVQEIVNSSIESSPRKSTRALISKFNAIGNMTKVTVNSNFFAKNNNASPKAKTKRYSQEYSNNFRDVPINRKIDRDISKYFLPNRPEPKRDSTSLFTEIFDADKAKVTAVDVKPSSTPITTTTPQALAAELDEVATGIARLRRELDDRPKMIENMVNGREKVAIPKKEPPVVVNRVAVTRDRQLAEFDKEFTKIFDEIDKQLKNRDSRIVPTNIKNNSTVNDIPITNQVAKVIDILVNAEKDAAATKNIPQPSKEPTKPTATSENSGNKVTRTKETTSTVRISGVDDKTTADLKEMLKEMKHSLPKRSKSKKSPEAEKKPEEKNRLFEVISNKPSTSSYRDPEETVVPPKISTKVSSGVQTSGNVRRIITAANSRLKVHNNSTNETSSKVLSPKNSYQLFQANEFANKAQLDNNTYANVIEKSLYTNAQITQTPTQEKEREPTSPAAKIDLRGGNKKTTASPVLPRVERSGSLGADKSDSIDEGIDFDDYDYITLTV